MTYTDPTGGWGFPDPWGSGGGGCDPDDPFCDPCEDDPELCYPGGYYPGGGGGGGGGGTPEKPRPFPWPLLPPVIFSEFATNLKGDPWGCVRAANGSLRGCYYCCTAIFAGETALCSLAIEFPLLAAACELAAADDLRRCKNSCLDYSTGP
jgi:hypothetical protein